MGRQKKVTNTQPSIDIEDIINTKEQSSKKTKPKQKKHISLQTKEEYTSKKNKILKFIEQPDIKQQYRLSYREIGQNGGYGITLYQGSPSNCYAIFRHRQFDFFYKTSTKRLFIQKLGRFSLDLKEDFEK